MHLILNGGGCGNQVKESYELFANLVKNGKIVLILSTSKAPITAEIGSTIPDN